MLFFIIHIYSVQIKFILRIQYARLIYFIHATEKILWYENRLNLFEKINQS